MHQAHRADVFGNGRRVVMLAIARLRKLGCFAQTLAHATNRNGRAVVWHSAVGQKVHV